MAFDKAKGDLEVGDPIRMMTQFALNFSQALLDLNKSEIILQKVPSE